MHFYSTDRICTQRWLRPSLEPLLGWKSAVSVTGLGSPLISYSTNSSHMQVPIYNTNHPTIFPLSSLASNHCSLRNPGEPQCLYRHRISWLDPNQSRTLATILGHPHLIRATACPSFCLIQNCEWERLAWVTRTNHWQDVNPAHATMQCMMAEGKVYAARTQDCGRWERDSSRKYQPSQSLTQPVAGHKNRVHGPDCWQP
jgi:hypothetical protein